MSDHPPDDRIEPRTEEASAPMTTTDRPSTPAEALRWYARRENVGDSPEGRAWAEQLRRWADELDAAPRRYELPPEPGPEVTELWDVIGIRWFHDADDLKPYLWWSDGNAYPPRYWRELLARGWLSTAPPTTEETNDDH